MQGNALVKAIIAVAVLIFISALALTVYKSGGAALNWQMGGDDPVLRIYPSDDGLYAIGASNISLVDSAGKRLWSVPFANISRSAYGGGRLLAYIPGDGLYAIDSHGAIALLTRQSIDYPPVVGPDGMVLARSWYRLMALDASGRELWNASSPVSNPAMDGRGYTYYFTRPEGTDVYLNCMAPDGKLRWTILYPRYEASTRLMAAGSDGVLVYDEPSGILSRLSSSGDIAWDHTMPYLGQYSLVSEGSRLYLFYVFGTVHVINDRGIMVGKFNPVVDYEANLSYMPAVCNGTVYVGGDAGNGLAALFALEPDGTLKWKRTFNSTAPPVIYAGDDIVCVGADAKSGPVLYVIGASGDLKFTYNSGDGSDWEQVYIDANDTIYAKTARGMLYALKG